jgi:hypothetical protein
MDSGRIVADPEMILKLLLSTQCEDETLSDREHRTIRNRETRFSPVGTSQLLGQMASCCSRKNGVSVTCSRGPSRLGNLPKPDFAGTTKSPPH